MNAFKTKPLVRRRCWVTRRTVGTPWPPPSEAFWVFSEQAKSCVMCLCCVASDEGLVTLSETRAHKQSADLSNICVWQFRCRPSHCTDGRVQAAKRLFILAGCYNDLEAQLVCVSSSRVHTRLSPSLRCKVGGGGDLDCVHRDGYVRMHNRPACRSPLLVYGGHLAEGHPPLNTTSAIGGRRDSQRWSCLHTRVGGESGLHVRTAL